MTAPKEGLSSVVENGFRVYANGRKKKILRAPPTLKGMFPEFVREILNYYDECDDGSLGLLLEKHGIDITAKRTQGRRIEPLPVKRISNPADELIRLATLQVVEWERQAKAMPPIGGNPLALPNLLRRISRWRAAIAAAEGRSA